MNYKQVFNDLSLSRLANITRNNLGHKNTSAMPAVALVAGLAIGAALSVLFAPKKGEDTRAMIAGGANDLSDAMMRKFNEAKKRLLKAETEATEIKDQVVTNVRKATKKAADKLATPTDTKHSVSEIKIS